MINTANLNADSLDRIPEENLLEVLGIDLHDIQADESHTAEWIESSENKTWELPTYGLVIGSRVVMWTHTDEAGIDDVTIVDAECISVDDDTIDVADQVREYAEEIAEGLGELVSDDDDDKYRFDETNHLFLFDKDQHQYNLVFSSVYATTKKEAIRLYEERESMKQ